jgi:hypothetical protein
MDSVYLIGRYSEPLENPSRPITNRPPRHVINQILSAEHACHEATHNPLVAGSSPAGPTCKTHGQSALLVILIVSPDPELGPLLSPPLRCPVEDRVVAHQKLKPPGTGGVRVVHDAVGERKGVEARLL